MATQSPFRFLDLPFELRLQIYYNYLKASYDPPRHLIHEEPRHFTTLKQQSPLLTVCKQVSSELLKELRYRDSFTYRISWRESTFDGLARSCFRARKAKPGYCSMSHLRIEFYPPHPDRPTNMVHIFQRAERLCYKLRVLPSLQHLTIEFLENSFARWSVNGKPRDSMGVNPDCSDVEHILALYYTVCNVTKVNIHLPPSLIANKPLQELCRINKYDMEAHDSFELEEKIQSLGDIARSVAKAEPGLQWVEQRITRAKQVWKLEPGKAWASEKQLEYVQSEWPNVPGILPRWETVQDSDHNEKVPEGVNIFWSRKKLGL